MKYIVFLIIPLVLVCLYGGCGNSNNGNNSECVMLEDDPNFLSDFPDCPAEGAIMICNNYSCNLSQDGMPTGQEFLALSECSMADCTTIDCDLGQFSINMILENSNFSGVFTDQDEEEFDYVCIPIVN